jgi:hypothetical protein
MAYSTTWRPIERAEPTTWAIADSTESQLRSGHLLLGDLLDLLLGHLADDLRADRLGARLDARCLLQEVGHRRRLGDEVKLRSWNTVMTTGIGMPASIFWVRALNCLQNSMMLTPC